MSWKNSRAESAMREVGDKIMEEAAKRNAAEDKIVMGKWTITLKGNSKQSEEEVEDIMSQLVEFSKKCDEKTPNLEISIDPIIEE